MLKSPSPFFGATKCHGSSSLPARRAVLHTAPARLAQRTPQRQHGRVHALPVSELPHDLHAHIAAVYDLADAAVAAAGKDASSSSSGFLSPLTDTLEAVLKTLQTQLNRLNVPYSYGYSIILLTVMVKMLTLPLTKIQVCVLLQKLPGWRIISRDRSKHTSVAVCTQLVAAVLN